MKIIKNLLFLFFFLGINSVFGTNLDIHSVPKLEDSESETIDGKYTNGKYTSPREPSVWQIYKYCLDEYVQALPILISDRIYYGETDHGPNLIKKISDEDEHDPGIERLIQRNPIAETSLKPKITWLQHAAFLIQINNINILVDPLFYNSSKVYPSNFEPIYKPEDLPRIDVILISHNHEDHMKIGRAHV